jgi:hypothetical protein
VLLAALLPPAPARALSDAAREFMDVTANLEPLQCEKRRLRRDMALAEVEKRDADLKALRARFSKLNRDPRTAKLEKRLAVLKGRILDPKGGSRDPEDLEAISRQEREAFYRCD